MLGMGSMARVIISSRTPVCAVRIVGRGGVMAHGDYCTWLLDGGAREGMRESLLTTPSARTTMATPCGHGRRFANHGCICHCRSADGLGLGAWGWPAAIAAAELPTEHDSFFDARAHLLLRVHGRKQIECKIEIVHLSSQVMCCCGTQVGHN